MSNTSIVGIVYLIQPAELVGTNRFKIGCSAKNTIDRCIDGYKKGSRCIYIVECINPFGVEKILIRAFGTNFKRIAGNEYFEGDETAIKQLFKNIVFSENEIVFLDDKPKEKSLSRADIKIKNIKDIVEAKIIDKDLFEYYMMKEKTEELTIDEQRSVNQYLYRKTFNINILTIEELEKIYGYRDIIYNFRKITSYVVKEPILDTEYLKKFVPLKIELIRKLIHTLGYTVSATSINEINKGERKLLNGIRDKLWSNFKDKTFVDIFGETRDETIQNLHILLASHIKMYGFDLIKHEVKLPADKDGKRKKDYEYCLKYHPIIVDYLTHNGTVDLKEKLENKDV